jgi:beta-lactamase class A
MGTSEPDGEFSFEEEMLVHMVDDNEWAIEVYDLDRNRHLAGLQNHRLMRTASLGKLYLLLEIAEQIATGQLAPGQLVDRRAMDPVADSGLWQHMQADLLTVVDAAVLIGAVSDNLATNALINLVGLERVKDRAAQHAVDGSTLHDVVRNVRAPGDPVTLSQASARDLVAIFEGLHRGAGSPGASDLVLSWLSPGVDLSMVASAFALDPLAHAGLTDRGVRLWNKTGTDAGVRADAGLVSLDEGMYAYAVVCNWDAHSALDPREEVLATMQRVGARLRSLGEQTETTDRLDPKRGR